MIILDMDSSVSPTHGEQEATAYNGHFGCTCYHPLFLFYQFGDLERCALRPGNVHSTDDWESVLKPVVVRYEGRKVRLYFRGDAPFASPEMYEYLEAEDFLHAIRLPKNQVLQESITHLPTRPVGRNAIRWTRLSCRWFRDNAVRLQLHARAYNLANFMRTLALPKEVEQWSLTTLRA